MKKGVKRSKPKKERFPGLYGYTEILVKTALAEDVGPGDITTAAVVERAMKGAAEIVAKEELVVAGLFVAEKVFKNLDRNACFKAVYKDGTRVRKGSVIARVSGRLGRLLTAERVALNFLQRLSGIATLTGEFVKRVRPSKAKILDTRKTTPCMRKLERYAVKMGGGYNHRSGLFDAVLIKDNHIKAAGGVAEAVRKANKKYREETAVEVEVTTLKEAREAVRAGADIILLDNMTPERIRKALKVIDRRALVEVSGGVTLDNVKKVAAAGVDFISVGALTHSAPAVDISMKVTRIEGKG